MSHRVQHWLGGKPLASSSPQWFARHKSATDELVAEIARGNVDTVD